MKNNHLNLLFLFDYYNYSSVVLNTTIVDADDCWYSLDGWVTNVSYDCVNVTLSVGEVRVLLGLGLIIVMVCLMFLSL